MGSELARDALDHGEERVVESKWALQWTLGPIRAKDYAWVGPTLGLNCITQSLLEKILKIPTPTTAVYI